MRPRPGLETLRDNRSRRLDAGQPPQLTFGHERPDVLRPSGGAELEFSRVNHVGRLWQQCLGLLRRRHGIDWFDSFLERQLFLL
jgi:hypothetical protein